jgi:hypothetical protein
MRILKKPKTSPAPSREQLCRSGEGSASLIPHLHAANTPVGSQQEAQAEPVGQANGSRRKKAGPSGGSTEGPSA